MSLAELIYAIAFTTYMIGAGWSLRTDGDGRAVAVLAFGACLDFAITGLSMFGPAVFDMGATGRNFAIDLGALLGVVVWLLVVAAPITWRWGRRPVFHVLVVSTQVVWFVDYLAFLFGLHVYPMV